MTKIHNSCDIYKTDKIQILKAIKKVQFYHIFKPTDRVSNFTCFGDTAGIVE